MMKEKILKIINTIRKKKGLNELEYLNDNMSLGIDLEFDSLDLAQLTVLIEDEFSVDIFENDIIETVEEIYKCIESN